MGIYEIASDLMQRLLSDFARKGEIYKYLLGWLEFSNDLSIAILHFPISKNR